MGQAQAGPRLFRVKMPASVQDSEQHPLGESCAGCSDLPERGCLTLVSSWTRSLFSALDVETAQRALRPPFLSGGSVSPQAPAS